MLVPIEASDCRTEHDRRKQQRLVTQLEEKLMLVDSHLTAADVMTKDVVTVLPHTSIRHLAKLLAERDISGAPVVNDTGPLLGVVSEQDLLSWDDRPPERQAWCLIC